MPPVEDVFRTKQEPHLMADLLRQGWHGLKPKLPQAAQEAMTGLENSSLAAGAEGAFRTLAPADAVEAGLSALGPAGKYLGKGAAKAVGAATALGAGTEEAEAATGMRKVFYDLLRANAGDVGKARERLKAMQPAMSSTDRSQATKMLKADIPEAVVRRELMTDPNQPNAYEILEGRRNQTFKRPEDVFKIGDVLVPVSGDTTHAGVNVKRAGIDLQRPVEMQGGPEYGLINPDPWASELGAARAKQRSFERAAQNAKGDVLGLHVAMAPQGSHFAQHTNDLWREMLRSGPQIAPEHMAAFNTDVVRELQSKLMKSGKEVPSVARALRDWQGVTHGGVEEALQGNPELRKALMATADKPGWQHQGFPDMDMLYGAALDPVLKTGDVGGAVMRAAPGSPLVPSTRSKTYGFNIPGEHVGRLEVPLPPEMVFSETMNRFPAKKRAQALGSLRSAHTERPVNQQFIDEASKYTENQLKLLRGQ